MHHRGFSSIARRGHSQMLHACLVGCEGRLAFYSTASNSSVAETSAKAVDDSFSFDCWGVPNTTTSTYPTDEFPQTPSSSSSFEATGFPSKQDSANGGRENSRPSRRNNRNYQHSNGTRGGGGSSSAMSNAQMAQEEALVHGLQAQPSSSSSWRESSGSRGQSGGGRSEHHQHDYRRDHHHQGGNTKGSRDAHRDDRYSQAPTPRPVSYKLPSVSPAAFTPIRPLPLSASASSAYIASFFAHDKLLCDFTIRRVVRMNPTRHVQRTASGTSSVERSHMVSFEPMNHSTTMVESGGGLDDGSVSSSMAKREALAYAFRRVRDVDQSRRAIEALIEALDGVTLADIVGAEAAAAVGWTIVGGGKGAATVGGTLQPLTDEHLCEDVDVEFAALSINALLLAFNSSPFPFLSSQLPSSAALENEKGGAVTSTSPPLSLSGALASPATVARFLTALASCVGPSIAFRLRDLKAIAERHRLEALEAEAKQRRVAKEVGANVQPYPTGGHQHTKGRQDAMLEMASVVGLFESFLVGGMLTMDLVNGVAVGTSQQSNFVAFMTGVQSGSHGLPMHSFMFRTEIARHLAPVTAAHVVGTLGQLLEANHRHEASPAGISSPTNASLADEESIEGRPDGTASSSPSLLSTLEVATVAAAVTSLITPMTVAGPSLLSLLDACRAFSLADHAALLNGILLTLRGVYTHGQGGEGGGGSGSEGDGVGEVLAPSRVNNKGTASSSSAESLDDGKAAIALEQASIHLTQAASEVLKVSNQRIVAFGPNNTSSQSHAPSLFPKTLCPLATKAAADLTASTIHLTRTLYALERLSDPTTATTTLAAMMGVTETPHISSINNDSDAQADATSHNDSDDAILHQMSSKSHESQQEGNSGDASSDSTTATATATTPQAFMASHGTSRALNVLMPHLRGSHAIGAWREAVKREVAMDSIAAALHNTSSGTIVDLPPSSSSFLSSFLVPFVSAVGSSRQVLKVHDSLPNRLVRLYDEARAQLGVKVNHNNSAHHNGSVGVGGGGATGKAEAVPPSHTTTTSPINSAFIALKLSMRKVGNVSSRLAKDKQEQLLLLQSKKTRKGDSNKDGDADVEGMLEDYFEDSAAFFGLNTTQANAKKAQQANDRHTQLANKSKSADESSSSQQSNESSHQSGPLDFKLHSVRREMKKQREEAGEKAATTTQPYSGTNGSGQQKRSRFRFSGKIRGPSGTGGIPKMVRKH